VFYGLVGRPHARPVVERRNHRCCWTSSKDPEVKKEFAELGSSPPGSSRGTISTSSGCETARWTKVAKDNNIKRRGLGRVDARKRRLYPRPEGRGTFSCGLKVPRCRSG